MPNTKTVHVPHLFGTDAAYQMPRAYEPSKPTCVLINSFTMTSDLYDAQFKDETLLDAMNIIAVEPLGHGQTRTSTDTFTYWDTAIMTLQVLDALNIKGKVFLLGTSQGGWIVVRMALLRPDRIAGIIPLGTSMDSESERTRKLGNFDCIATLTGPIKEFESTTSTPDFVIPKSFRDFPIYVGFGNGIDDKTADWWHEEMKRNYSGDDGRKRLREVTINLRDRDGLHPRLSDVRCPVLWMHGTDDVAYGVPNAREEIEMFINSPDAKLQVVEGGAHYLSASHSELVDKALIEFVQLYSNASKM
jgi:pimeloyl-ACP methyl ester carboxylesterase